MARIKIEDLPVLENLTPEEEELIYGAGRRSFRPMLESLENREMMDAGLGSALQIPLAQPTGGNAPQLALVRQLVSETSQQVNHFVHSGLNTAQTAYSAAHQAAIDQIFTAFSHQNMPQNVPQALSQGLPQGQQHGFSVQGDSQNVTDRALRFLKDDIIGHGLNNGRFSNRWTLSNRVEVANTEVSGDQIKLTFNVWYGVQGDPCQVKFTFQGKNVGGVKQYDLVGAGLHDWKGVGFVGGQFEQVAKDLFRDKVGKIESQRFDVNKFAESVARRMEALSDAKGFQVRHVESFDGGLRVRLNTGKTYAGSDGGMVLEFKYNDADLSKGELKCSSAYSTVWYGGGDPTAELANSRSPLGVRNFEFERFRIN